MSGCKVSASDYGATTAVGVPDGLPRFSPNANALLDAAREEANRRGHSIAGTEHVLWALLQPACTARVLRWLESNIPAQEYGVPWRCAVLARLEANPVFAPTAEAKAACLMRTFSPNLETAVVGGAAASPQPPVLLSQSLRDALLLIPQFAGGPVRDGALTIEDGLVATEFVVASILLHSVNTAADILGRVSRGQINSWRVCEAIGADPTKIHVKREGLLELSTFDVGGGVSSVARASDPYVWGRALPDARALPPAPTSTSNWLLPGKLIIGEHPQPRDVRPLMDGAGVTTFVSLIGEYDMSEYQRRYPAEAAREGRSASFVHFPVRDFYVPQAEELRSIVLDLKRRLTQSGEVVFVHCRGGHGRTGTVVIPLIAALFDIDDPPAADFVLTATRTARASDRDYPQWCHMPETEEQIAVCREVNASVRLRTREGRR